MQGRLVLDILLARASTLNLLTTMSGGTVDAAAVELRLLYELQKLSETFDFELLTVISTNLFATQAGERQYALPADFGRFLNPNDEGEEGLFLTDGTTESALHYRAPWLFRSQQTTTNGRPAYFTVLRGSVLQLDPPPDTTAYTGTGVYIKAIDTSVLDLDYPVVQSGCLVDMVLGTLALDAQHPQAPSLLALADRARGRLLNANARQRQRFQSKTGRLAQETRQRFVLR